METTKTFEIFIKSSDERPDYEDWCEAKTKGEAAETFAGTLAAFDAGWSAESLLEYVHEVDD